MSSLPWAKWYHRDWRSEPKLKLCSRAARSLWLDYLGLIHEGGDHRLHINGTVPTDKQLGDILGDNPRTIKKLTAELVLNGVCSIDQEGFVYSRKVFQGRIKHERDATNGRMGGNPALKTAKNDDQGVNPPLKAKILEARYQSQSKERKSARADALPSNWESLFDVFWQEYPHKVGKGGPKGAKAAFSKALGTTEFEVLMQGLVRYKMSKPTDRPWCNPTTWLNQERWEDEEGATADVKSIGASFDRLESRLAERSDDEGVGGMGGEKNVISISSPNDRRST